MMQPFDCNQALHYLLKKARSVGMKNSQLIEGICDSSNFSKMCRGKRQPTYDVILQLSHKLNVSLDELQLYSSLKKPEEYLKLRQQFHQLRLARNYQAIKTLEETYRPLGKKNNPYFTPLLLWMRGITAATQQQNYRYALDLFTKSLSLLQPLFSLEDPNFSLLALEHLNLVHDVCLCYTHLGQLERPILIYERLITFLEDRPHVEDPSLLPTYCYSLSRIFIKKEDYSRATFYVQKGIDDCYQHLNLTILPFLYCHLAIIKQANHQTQQAHNHLLEALFLFKMQNKPLTFYKELHEFMQQYHLSLDIKNPQLNF